MIELSATYYDGKTSHAQPVRVRAYADGGVVITGDGLEVRVAPADLRLSPRLGNTVRSLALRDGAKCETADNDAVDALCALYGGHEGSAWRHRLEQSWRAAAGALTTLVALAVVFVVWGVPFIAKEVAMRLPDAVAYEMGKGTLELLDQGMFDPSALSEDDRAKVREAFDELAALEPDLPLHLEFRKMGLPNAFALPDGTVVVTDELVALARRPLSELEAAKAADEQVGDQVDDQVDDQADDQVDDQVDEQVDEQVDPAAHPLDDEALNQLQAVLAHEVGHVRHRHGVRMAIESSSIAIIVSVYIGDATQLSTVLTSLPAIYAQAGYSRDHETEADVFALALMRRAALSPRAFADVMRKLKAAVEPHGDRGDTPDVLAYLSSHPPTAERIARFEAEDAAEELMAPSPSSAE